MNRYSYYLLTAILGGFFLTGAWAQPQTLEPVPHLFPATPISSRQESRKEPPDYSRYGGTLTVAVGPIKTLDSQLATDINSRLVIANIQEGLYGYDEKNYLTPVLAYCLPEMQDEVTYLIYLREDIRFHDGSKFEAKDVVCTVSRLLNPDTAAPTRTLFANIKSAKAIDETTVEIKLNRPDNTLGHLFARQELFPLSKQTVEKHKQAYGKVIAVGTGPFRLVGWERGESITLKRSDTYREAETPYLNTLVFKPLPTAGERISYLEQRRLSVAANISPEATGFIESRYIGVLSKSGTLLEQIYLNTSRPPFDDKLLRQAISYGIDRKAIIKQVFGGHASVAYGIFPPWHWAHNKGWHSFSYDPEKAAELLKQSKYWSGTPLKFKLIYTNKPHFKKQARLIREQLDRIGFRVILQSMPKQELLDYIYGREGKDRARFAAALEDWQGGIHPDLYSALPYASRSLYNKTMFNNPLVDILLQDAGESVWEEEKGMFYRQVEKIVARDANTIYLCFPHQICAYRTYVVGLKLNPLGLINFAQVWMKK